MDDLEAIRRVISQTGMSQARAARIVMQPPAGAARKRLLDGIGDGLKEVPA